MRQITYHDESGSLRVVNLDNVREVTFVHRNVNVREEIILRHTDNSETRLPKSQKQKVAVALDLSPDDFLTPGERADRAALTKESV